MAIKLPDFTGTQCIYMQACGRLPGSTSNKSVKREMVSRFKATSGTQYVRLLQTGDPITHVHVDVARKEYFAKAPTITHKRRELDSALAAHSGQELELFVRAVYLMLDSSLPTAGLILAGPNKVVTRLDETEVELTGAFLTLKNASIDRIEWEIKESGVFIDLIRTRKTALTPSYITDAFGVTNEAFKTYVLGKTSLRS